VLFKAPWVKVSAMASEEKSNIFQATVLSMQNEEAILQIKDSRCPLKCIPQIFPANLSAFFLRL